MIIYQKNKKSYIEDVNLNVFVDILLKDLTDKIGKTPSPSEKRSFENSSRYMVGILSDNEIPDDCGVSIEYNIPSTGKRVDFIITGKNDKDEKLAIIIELKQWEKVEKTDQDGIVSTFINGQIRETLHPSYQAWSYAALLKDFNVNVYENNIALSATIVVSKYFGKELSLETIGVVDYTNYPERVEYHTKGKDGFKYDVVLIPAKHQTHYMRIYDYNRKKSVLIRLTP